MVVKIEILNNDTGAKRLYFRESSNINDEVI